MNSSPKALKERQQAEQQNVDNESPCLHQDCTGGGGGGGSEGLGDRVKTHCTTNLNTHKIQMLK